MTREEVQALCKTAPAQAKAALDLEDWLIAERGCAFHYDHEHMTCWVGREQVPFRRESYSSGEAHRRFIASIAERLV